ncbi:hypothetical protein HH214_19015 [Mucilaginibacter robiniae]|uniref:Outer membrane protein beta-barrel domain-containing protein n=1 Tax=Mucilaginibacter robiniae TaxID=2728022 RepID=A0A7L5E5B7_9SPHI|nr:hypothetical protein [Mucilaginibacter robiniae]QJD97818.1 hypothetical protein HH214_19015 [Mucilaginibacter robiniae]
MKKILFNFLLLVVFLGFQKTANAQIFASNERYSESSLHISVGAEGMYNINPGKNYYKAGVGGTLRFQYDLTQNLGLTLTSGFYNITHDKGPRSLTKEDIKFIPVKFGGKAYFLPEWYLGGEVGVGYIDPSIVPRTQTHFVKVIAPSIGYESNHIDASFRYENINNQNNYVSVVALRLAYIFNF